MEQAKPPRILLAEDDPVSRAFLTETLRQLGCVASATTDGPETLDAARSLHFDLLILDRCLPRMTGEQVLRTLRGDAAAAAHAAPAIAATADTDATIHAQLRAAGFADVLVKPLAAATLRRALAGFCQLPETPPLDVLDDAAGLAASGNPATLAALRGLFATELQTLLGEFDTLRTHRDALRDRLHRLRAACGFCGATSLQRAAIELSEALQTADPGRIAESEETLHQALVLTLQALRRDTTG